jgi:hypothetical protein
MDLSRSRWVIAAIGLTACAARTDESEGTAPALEAAISFTETTATALRDQPCGNGIERGCYSNYAVIADLNNDGNFDLVFANGGNHFVPGTPEPQAVYFGDGSGSFNDASAAFAGMADSIVRQVAVADFDNDEKLDVFFPGGYGRNDDQLFMQMGTGTFQNQTDRLAGETRSRAGAVHAGDIDNDGDMDLVVADWGDQPNAGGHTPVSPVTVRISVNDGHGHFTAGPVLAAPGGSSATDIDLHDVNGDFSLDIVLTNRNGQSRLYANDGFGHFEDVTESKAFPPKRGPFTFNAELCDVNGDGSLDLAFDGGASFVSGHSTQLLINDGTGKFTDESERLVGEPQSDDNQVKCVDLDGDDDFDLVVASLSNPTEKIFRNIDGKGHFQLVDGVLPRLSDPTLSLDFGDFDNDGKVDMMTAQGESRGQPWLNRIFKNTSNTVDHRKPIFRSVEKPRASANQPTIVRLAVSDVHTSETGQHVKSVSVGVTIGGHPQEIPAHFMGGDIFRAIVPPQPAGTTVEITAHAVDRMGNEATGAPFSVTVSE